MIGTCTGSRDRLHAFFALWKEALVYNYVGLGGTGRLLLLGFLGRGLLGDDLPFGRILRQGFMMSLEHLQSR